MQPSNASHIDGCAIRLSLCKGLSLMAPLLILLLLQILVHPLLLSHSLLLNGLNVLLDLGLFAKFGSLGIRVYIFVAISISHDLLFNIGLRLLLSFFGDIVHHFNHALGILFSFKSRDLVFSDFLDFRSLALSIDDVSGNIRNQSGHDHLNAE